MKKLLAILLSVSMLFVACGKSDKQKESITELDALTKEIASLDAFDDKISPLEKDSAILVFGLDEEDIKDISCYMNTSATPEMIVAIAVNGDIDDVKADLEEYFESERDSFADYVPEEVVKVQNAILEQKDGNIIVACISRDSEQVKNILDKYN